MAFKAIDVYLWQKQIFNYHIAKGYLTFNQLANFDIFSEEYQRSINHEHEDKILEYLKKIVIFICPILSLLLGITL